MNLMIGSFREPFATNLSSNIIGPLTQSDRRSTVFRYLMQHRLLDSLFVAFPQGLKASGKLDHVGRDSEKCINAVHNNGKHSAVVQR